MTQPDVPPSNRCGPRATWWVWLLGVVAGLAAFWALGQAENPSKDGERLVSLSSPRPPEPLTLVFIDSLSDRVAQDAGVMPNLAGLRAQGAAFRVEPCRDRLTYRCLYAAFRGSDASSVMSLQANFSHQQMGQDTILHLAAKRGRVVGAGAHDLEAYQDAFAAFWPFPSATSPEGEVVGKIAGLGPADVTVIGFSSGDRAAHAHGTDAPAYAESFREIDRSLGELIAQAPANGHIVVFGDHGHDRQGRHLPGGEATTYAVYRGPGVQSGVTGELEITDHRALLGVLLGLPTPAFYQGPAMNKVLHPGWLRERYGEVPELRGRPIPLLGRAERSAMLLALGLACVAALVALARGLAPGWRAAAPLALFAVALRALSGLGYEPLGWAIHDHGDQPWRSAYLLVPLLSGFAVAGLSRAGWLRGSGLSILATFFLLFSTANYYGAARALPFAGLLALVVSAGWLLRRRALSPYALVLLALSAAALGLYYDVARVGGAGGAQGYFELKAWVFREQPRATLVVCKVLAALLLAGFGGASAARWAGAALLGAGALLSALRVELPAAALPLGLLATALLWRTPVAALSAGWLLLDLFYKPAQAAGLNVLLVGALASLLVWQEARVSDELRGRAQSLVLLVAGYLALWPIAGMRLAGIDFSFMFRWIEVSRYEEFWWLIALGVWVKQAWPYALLALAARMASFREGWQVRQLASAKVLTLALFAAAWGLVGPLTALPGQEALNELAGVLFVLAILGVGAALARLSGRFRRAAT